MSELLKKKVESMIESYNMISSGDCILVALSGGSDSCVLLHYILSNYRCSNENSENRIYAAHLNHMIRGEEADSDENFVKNLCSGKNIEIFVDRIDIPKVAKDTKRTLEETARDERYAFFRRVCKKIGGNVKVATAHNASDNTESVIFNISRGGGTKGLRGIAPVSGNIIRPMLSCTKDEILEYCEENNIKYVEDKTNADESYTRNFIRHSVTKILRSKFLRLDENIFKASELARADTDFIDGCADSFMYENKISDSSEVSVLLSAHKAVRSRVLIKMCGGGLEYKHIEYIEEVMRRGVNVSINLPNGVVAEISYGCIFIKRRGRCEKRARREKLAQGHIELVLDGEVNTVDFAVKAYIQSESSKDSRYSENSKVDKTDGCGERQEIENSKKADNFCKINKSSENVYNLFNHACIDFDKIVGRIYIRNRQINDEYVFFGQTKSVKKNYINYKVPANIRDILPILCDGGGIVWACGLPVCDRVKVTDDSKKIVVVEVSRLQF